MTKIRFIQVYRINGRLVVANSIEDAISTWREWMSPSTPDIVNIEKLANDSYQCAGQEALVYAEELCGDTIAQLNDDIAKLNEEKAKLTYDIKKREAYYEGLEKRIRELSACAGK